jgi:hypothetical protein
MRAFLRIILVIPLGLIAAILAATAVYLAAFGFPLSDFSATPEGLPPPVLRPALLLTAVIARTALLPFLVAIAASEIFAFRSLLGWLLFGGLLGFGLQLLGFPPELAAPSSFLPPTAGGIAGAFAYWLIAGRGAGLSLTSPGRE